MTEKISKSQYLIITAILTLGVIFNFTVWHNAGLGGLLGGLYLIFFSFIAGAIITRQKAWQPLLGFLLLTSLIAIGGALALYFYQFNDLIFVILIFLIPAGLIVPYYKTEVKQKFSLKKIILEHFDRLHERREPKINLVLVYAYLTCLVIGFSLLVAAQTSRSIQSPFEVIGPGFFSLYFVATAILATYLLVARRAKLPLTLLIVHTFFSSAIALIVYRLGYGFDPFIHQAAEKIIAATGNISPKTLYYLGQYAIVIFFHKLTLADISLIERLLVPVFGALTLPTITYFVFSHWLKKNYALILSLSLLIVPFVGLIMTTPQNLANIFFILTVLLSLLYYRGEIKLWPLVLLTLGALAIHPLAGIPLTIVVFLLALFKKGYQNYQRHLVMFGLTALVLTAILPLAFISNGSTFPLTLPRLTRSDLPLPQLVNKFDLALDLVYFLQFNHAGLAILVIIIGLIFLAQNKLLKNNAPYLMAAAVMMIDFIVIKYLMTFPALSDFDKTDFVQRVSQLAFYTLWPIFLTGLYVIIKRFWIKKLLAKIFIILLLSGLITAAFYLSYPQINQYAPAKFFSLSDSDLKAVRLIEQIANPEHIVLANQMIGVAAIKEFGFKKYYNNQFYYSMPNGSPRTFYDRYLDMIYQGTKPEFMYLALNEAGAAEAYFVLNRYWRDAEKIAEQARQSATAVYEIDNGEVYIFKYERN